MTTGTTALVYEFGPFRMDLTQRVLLHHGQPVALAPKDFDLLLVLVVGNGQLVEKDELLRRGWPDSFVEEGNVSHHIFTLRRVLENDGQKYIETVPRRGYRFVGTVPSVDPSLADSEEQRPRSRRASAFLIGAAVLLVSLVVALGWRFASRTPREAPGERIRLIAVLPFKPLTPGDRNESLELGMADTLITKLAAVVHIASRPIGAMRKYTAPDQDPVAAGRELGVEAVVDGSIQRVGDRVRVTVRLVNVNDGRILWADNFDAPFTGIFGVQDAIVGQMTDRLAVRLNAEEKRQTKRPTDSPEAYELYLKGRYEWNKRTEAGLRRSIDYFERAARRAPDYSLAYSGLADAYGVLSSYANVAPAETLPFAKQAAERALALDETVAEAHTSLGLVKESFEWDWQGAERHYRRALALNPQYTSAHQRYGVFLCITGRCAEGLEEKERARRLDPTSVVINTDEGMLYCWQRRYGDAVAQLRTSIELEPSFARPHVELAGCYVQQRRYDEAIDEAGTAVDLSGGRANTVLAYTYASAGRVAEARQLLDGVTAQAQQRFTHPLAIAATYIVLGQRDEAFSWLQKGYAQHAYIGRVHVDPMFDAVRSDPRYRDLMQRIGLGTD